MFVADFYKQQFLKISLNKETIISHFRIIVHLFCNLRKAGPLYFPRPAAGIWSPIDLMASKRCRLLKKTNGELVKFIFKLFSYF